MRDEGLDTLTIGFAIYHLSDPDSAPKPLDTDFMRYNRSCARSKVKNVILYREMIPVM